ncbi:hypothetical protein TNIN_327341 [Trichonephila inaurata madagascariensis]|uniref:Uncharacterized protein n=1 Tax=Trichonephila inaurata madagascariensis TaxID=2747483 RepID=A0A8X7BX85_9ARAC|nr:hypothetical protein TNIN_327341 [Trichonephila inaurata madagascariensis]
MAREESPPPPFLMSPRKLRSPQSADKEEKSRARKKVAVGEVCDVTCNVHQLSASSVHQPHSGYDNSAQLMLGYDWRSHSPSSDVYSDSKEGCEEHVTREKFDG